MVEGPDDLYGAATPVPETHTLSDVLVAVVAMRSVAPLVPNTLGEYVTPIVHEAPAASCAGQALRCAKYCGSLPVSLMPVMENDTAPLL